MARAGERKAKRSWVPIVVMASAFALLGGASWFVPQRTTAIADTEAAKIDRGPASYFHHFYDPDGLLGQVGSVDLELDNFERATGHSILVAGFRTLPGNDPDFTMKVAEKWRPGVNGRDNGVILFVFVQEKRIRAEVGYGLEDVLPDAEVMRILDEAAIPAFRGGDFVAGLAAATERIRERAQGAPSAAAAPRTTPWTAIKGGLRAVPRAAKVVGSVLLAASFGQRLGASFFIVLIGAIVAALVGDVVASVRTVVTVVRGERDVEGAKKVGDALFRLFYDASKVGIVFFVIAIGGSYFFSGFGRFGGGGVDVPW